MTKATILHNPKCGTSRRVLTMLEGAGAEVTIVPYLDAPPTPARLAALLDRAGLRPADALRRKEAGADALAGAADADVLAAMAADPRLIERPIVETARGVRLCRPAERVHDIL